MATHTSPTLSPPTRPCPAASTTSCSVSTTSRRSPGGLNDLAREACAPDRARPAAAGQYHLLLHLSGAVRQPARRSRRPAGAGHRPTRSGPPCAPHLPAATGRLQE